MTLTTALASPSSSIRRWFDRRFPHVQRTAGTWAASLAGSSTIRPRPGADVDWATIGGAFGLRLGFACDAAPPYTALDGLSLFTGDDTLRHTAAGLFPTHATLSPADRLADLRPLPDGQVLTLPPLRWGGSTSPADTAAARDFAARLARFVTHYLFPLYPPHQPRPAVEQQAARACWTLALFESYARGGPEGLRGLDVAPSNLTTELLLKLAPDYAIDDLTRLGLALVDRGVPQLARLLTGGHARIVVEPTFLAGWADGDLLVGDCLVDCKTTVRPVPLRPEWLYQLLGYALLDTADLYRIRRVGIYLARQARLVTWPLDELLAVIAGRGRQDLDQTRHEFLAPLTATLPDAASRLPIPLATPTRTA